MSVANFIPEVWAAQLLSSLKKSLVFAGPGVCNRNYEGEIANMGDTVRITSITRRALSGTDVWQRGVPAGPAVREVGGRRGRTARAGAHR